MSPKTILLVEDDELDVISVQRTLKKFYTSYNLQVAHNGKEALTMLTRLDNPVRPDVVLLDLNMPKMNGIEFLKMIRQDPMLKNLQVFVMTTSSETSDRTVTEQLGVAGYIIKPLGYTNDKKVDSMDAFVQFHLRKILTADA
ncbi:MAG TPA: response regulator [Flavisolibacter sp.]|jgi:CheY-like chemotaxis protein|nr:response regulator [Flavisolibacter sp.]